MENGSRIDTETKVYYESKIEELSNKKPKLSISEIEELANDIADSIYYVEDSDIDAYYEIAFNKIHEKYGV